MDIEPGVKAKLEKLKKRLFYFNYPLLIACPALDLLKITDSLTQLFIYSDVTLHLFWFYMIYNTIVNYFKMTKTVLSIDYLPESDKLIFKQFKGKGLNEKETIYEPKDLQKCSKELFDNQIGYEDLKTNFKFRTENIAMWHDRQFFNSIIHKKIRISKIQQRGDL